MEGQNKKIIDLRGTKPFGLRELPKLEAPMPPQQKKIAPVDQQAEAAKPQTNVLDAPRIDRKARRVKLLAFAALAAIDIALISFFALSENYLASFLFFLIAITLTLMITQKSKKIRPESRQDQNEEETLPDIFAKFIGL